MIVIYRYRNRYERTGKFKVAIDLNTISKNGDIDLQINNILHGEFVKAGANFDDFELVNVNYMKGADE